MKWVVTNLTNIYKYTCIVITDLINIQYTNIYTRKHLQKRTKSKINMNRNYYIKIQKKNLTTYS